MNGGDGGGDGDGDDDVDVDVDVDVDFDGVGEDELMVLTVMMCPRVVYVVRDVDEFVCWTCLRRQVRDLHSLLPLSS